MESSAALRPQTAEGARGSAIAAREWTGPLLGTFVVPAGVAIAVGLALAHWLTPQWKAGGLMHATGYPKNVEITATLAAVALGAASALLVRWPRLQRLALLPAGCGWVLGLWTIGATSLPIVLPVLAGFAALAIGLDRALAAPAAGAGDGGRG